MYAHTKYLVIIAKKKSQTENTSTERKGKLIAKRKRNTYIYITLKRIAEQRTNYTKLSNINSSITQNDTLDSIIRI